MILLKQLLLEQLDDVEISDELLRELEEELKTLDEADGLIWGLVGNVFGNVFAEYGKEHSLAIGAAAALYLLPLFKKQIGKGLKFAASHTVKLTASGLAVAAPWRPILSLSYPATRAKYIQTAIEKPFQNIAKNSTNSAVRQEAQEILNRLQANQLVYSTLANKTVRLFKRDTYGALRKLRDAGGREYINYKTQTQLSQLFVELKGINKTLFNQDYVEVTLKSLNIAPLQIDEIHRAVFGKVPIRAVVPMDKGSLQATQKSAGALQPKPKLTFAQNTYMSSLPYDERQVFQRIIDNLSGEIEKRAQYIDELMAKPTFPSQAEWMKLDIPNKDTWGIGDKLFNYNQDKLFYHANKLSGSIIR